MSNQENITFDMYVSSLPEELLAINLFKGSWSSYIPGYGGGTAILFNDDRITWFDEQCGGFKNKNILELGPLEGGHTYMMSHAGANTIKSIEANTSSFMKCLLVQNALKFSANFILGDFRLYLNNCAERFDFVLASGVLYHMTDPIKLLQDITKVSNSIGIWTHYYDDNVQHNWPHFNNVPEVSQVGSRTILMHKQSYSTPNSQRGFCGGSSTISFWLTRDSLLGLLNDLNFEVVIGNETKEHQNGPAITLYAYRR